VEGTVDIIIDVIVAGAIATGVSMAGLFLFKEGMRKTGRLLIFGAPVTLTVFFLVHLTTKHI